MPTSTTIPATEPEGPSFRVFQSSSTYKPMALKLYVETRFADTSVWLTTAKARALGAALIAHSDDYDAAPGLIAAADEVVA